MCGRVPWLVGVSHHSNRHQSKRACPNKSSSAEAAPSEVSSRRLLVLPPAGLQVPALAQCRCRCASTAFPPCCLEQSCLPVLRGQILSPWRERCSGPGRCFPHRVPEQRLLCAFCHGASCPSLLETSALHLSVGILCSSGFVRIGVSTPN